MSQNREQSESAGDLLRREGWRRVRLWAYAVIGMFCVVLLYMWWLLGTLVFGLIASILLLGILSYETAVRIKEARRTFVAGAEGEELVDQRLRALADRGWRYRNNVPKPGGGDIDHMLWGPRGVFVIETKATRGRVALEAGRLTFDRHLPEKDFLQQTYANALAIRDHLSRELGRRVWVVAVLCLTEAFIENYRIDIAHPPVHVVKVERFLEFIQDYTDTQPLNDATIQQIAEAMDRFSAA
jgi:hypothetical protein